MEAPTLKALSCFICRDKKLKCDRRIPVCGRCARLGTECIYPSTRQSNTGKRKQVQDIAAKLEELENQIKTIKSREAGDQQQEQQRRQTLLSTASLDASPLVMSSTESMSQPAELDGNRYRSGLHGLGGSDLDTAAENKLQSSPVDGTVHRSPGLVEELIIAYFDNLQHAAPMIHRSRFMSSLHLPAGLQPPAYLQHAIMATGASTYEKHASLAMPLYQQARALAEAEELSNHNDTVVNVGLAQTWMLLANFEARGGRFSRASMSLGRSIRIAQMLNLHQLDLNDQRPGLFSQELPPSQDRIELEERRRTWWVIYIADRLVFATSGLPVVIDDRQVHTLLPASEEAFESGTNEQTSSLQNALRDKSFGNSRLAARVIAASLFHRAVEITPQPPVGDNGHNSVGDDEFWNRIQDIDNDLMSCLLLLPKGFQMSVGFGCQHVVFVNVLIQTAIMCLHKAAMGRARCHGGPQAAFIARQSRDRMFAAAMQVAAIYRSTQDITAALQNPIQNYAVYIAALVLIEDFTARPDPQSKSNAAFLLNTLQTMGREHAVSRMLGAHLMTQAENIGIDGAEHNEVKPP